MVVLLELRNTDCHRLRHFINCLPLLSFIFHIYCSYKIKSPLSPFGLNNIFFNLIALVHQCSPERKINTYSMLCWLAQRNRYIHVEKMAHENANYLTGLLPVSLLLSNRAFLPLPYIYGSRLLYSCKQIRITTEI